MLARRIATALVLATGVLGAGALLTSIALADPPLRRIDMSKIDDAGGDKPGAGVIIITPTPPDPPQMREQAQWIFDLRWRKGDVYLLGVHAYELPAAQPTPRAMGRFAVELFEGPTLIERVRFDFPLLGAPDLEDEGGVSISKNLTTRIGVMFPSSRRGTRLELVDRATDTRWPLPWPPVDTRAHPEADASTDASAGGGR